MFLMMKSQSLESNEADKITKRRTYYNLINRESSILEYSVNC